MVREKVFLTSFAERVRILVSALVGAILDFCKQRKDRDHEVLIKV